MQENKLNEDENKKIKKSQTNLENIDHVDLENSSDEIVDENLYYCSPNKNFLIHRNQEWINDGDNVLNPTAENELDETQEEYSEARDCNDTFEDNFEEVESSEDLEPQSLDYITEVRMNIRSVEWGKKFKWSCLEHQMLWEEEDSRIEFEFLKTLYNGQFKPEHFYNNMIKYCKCDKKKCFCCFKSKSYVKATDTISDDYSSIEYAEIKTCCLQWERLKDDMKFLFFEKDLGKKGYEYFKPCKICICKKIATKVEKYGFFEGYDKNHSEDSSEIFAPEEPKIGIWYLY